MKLQPKHKLALGFVMIAISMGLPSISVAAHLEFWQVLLLVNLPCWFVSWFGGMAIGKGWGAMRSAQFDNEQVQLQTILDAHFKQMAELTKRELQ